MLAAVFRKNLQLPATTLSVARIHAKQIASKNGGFITAGAGANFKEDVAPIIRILGQEHALQVFFQINQPLFGFADFLNGHLAHVRVVILEQRLSTFKISLHFKPGAITGNNRLNFRVLLGIGAEFGLI